MTNDTRQMDARELADKVHWEGGVISTLEYGIRSEDIEDPELASLWQRMEELYDQLRPSVVLADRMLRATRRSARLAGTRRAA